ncbi:hypothetical protein BsWGS_28336 [Bradybaena similaris]
MFGEYAQVATFMQPGRSAMYQNDVLYQEPLPAYLRPSYHMPQAWSQGRAKCGLIEDFIMIAEFSELEGPKPLMTIPKDGGDNFDQNTFAVRILAVDHQNSTDGFSISEDAQVVVSDGEAGVYAFVHHLVLYDNTARGFVRPYCIAFITTDQRKLMRFYEELSWKFKKVARFLKYGNKMVFVGDLERHLKDLEYTKNVLLNQVCKIRLRHVEGQEEHIPDARRNAENELYRGLETIRQSSQEIREILSVLKPLLPDLRLENRFRKLEQRAYQGFSSAGLDKLSLPESGFADLTAVDELDLRCGSLSEPRLSPLALFNPREYRPVLVETKKARRFNAPLRGLHELCSWGAKEGLKKLRHIHMYFKRDMTILELEKNESRLLRPRNASVHHGQCVTGNFLAGVQMKKSLEPTEEAEQGWSMLYSHNWSSLGSLNSVDSFKSVDSSPSPNGCTEASPSSFHTYDSLSGPAFQSVTSSPEREFSFLTSDEYYPDMASRHTQAATYVQADPVNKALQNTLDENREHFQEHLEDSSRSGDECNDKEKTTDMGVVQVDSEFSQKTTNVNENCSNSNSDSLLSCINTGVSQKEAYTATNKDNTHNSERPNYSFVSTEIKVCTEESNIGDHLANSLSADIPNAKDDIIHRCRATVLQKKQDLSAFEKGCSEINSYSQNGCFQGKSVMSPKSDQYDGSFGTGDSIKTTRSLSANLVHSSGKISSSQIHNDIQDDLQNILPKDLKAGVCQSDSENNHGVSREYRKCTHNPVEIQRCDSMLSLMLEQEENQRNESKASVADVSPECSQRNSEKMSSNKPLQVCENKSPSSERLADTPSDASISNSEGSNHIGNNSKHSHVKNYPQFAHHITNISRSEKSAQSEVNHSDQIRARTESDASSAFTEISIQDMYPHLMGVRAESNDSTLHDGSQAACTTDDCNDIPTSQNTAVWRPRCGMYTVGDWINNMARDRPGFGLSEVLSTYQYFEHVIFSLLSGRPVLVAGSARLESEVIKVVNALAVFVPVTRRKSHTVLEWTSKPVKITDLIKLKLIGVCRPERRSLDSFIPGAIKKACTVVDIEKRTIVAPPYQGQFIATLMAKRKVLKSDIQLLTYIEWWLMDILAKAFIFFHSFCLGSGGSILYSHSPKDQRDAYLENVSVVMGRLGVRDCDCQLIEHLTEVVKLSKLEHHIWQGLDPGSIVTPLTLQQRVCERFRC